jgi:DNA invertase Pin-like site-specific DNA recombinase
MQAELPASDNLVVAPIPAVEYRRASDEDQKFSTQNQSVINHAYAATHGMVIVRTYTDEGKSGLNVERRDALKQMIAEVERGNCDFKAIVVYDVSRWGRFQDTDESAHYEFLCKHAGIQVHYCAEQFENDGSPLSAIIKGIKRAMAAEYSRELSTKVSFGQRRIAKLGYSLGASAPYGLRRLLVDEFGKPKCILARGDRKSIHKDRTIMAPGPATEIKIVRWIFATFASRKMRQRQIARALNRRGIRNVVGKRWTSTCIRRVLTNERYIGNNVWHRTSGKLRTKRINTPPEQWVRVEGAFKAIVDREVFDQAQAVLREEKRIVSLEDKLEPLRRLLRQHGYLTKKLIDQAPGVPSSLSYRRWFGNLYPAYALVGFNPAWRQPRPRRVSHATTRSLSRARLLEGLRQLLINRGFLSQNLIDESTDLPCSATYCNRFGSIQRAYQLIGYAKPSQRAARFRADGVHKLSDEKLLDKLRALLAEKGYLTAQLISSRSDMPSVSTYLYRFGFLTRAYELIGYDVGPNTSRSLREYRQTYTDNYLLEALKKLREKYGALSLGIMKAARAVPSSSTYQRHFGSMSRAFELIGYAPDSGQEASRPPAARSRRPQNPRRYSNRDMLRALRALQRKRGCLSQKIIDKSRSVPSASLYAARFGNLSRAYKLIGYRPSWYAHRPKRT